MVLLACRQVLARELRGRGSGLDALSETKSETTGSLATALHNAMRLLASKPALAEVQAREILAVVPGSPQALLILARARAAQGDWDAARDILAPLCRAQ